MQKYSYIKKSQRGLTLVELVIIIVVLGILAAIVLSRLGTSKEQAKLASCKSNLRNFQTALAGYYVQQGEYPVSINDLDVPAKLKLCPSQGTYSYLLESGAYRLECKKHGLLLTEDGIETLKGGEEEDNELPDYPNWNTNTSYRKNEYVIYHGRVFQARYYAGPSQVPGEIDSPWQEITDQWRNFNIYDKGDIVIYNDKKFQARYWTQNSEPGLMESPWQEITDQWRTFNIYRAGDEVFYNGKKYRAKHHSQNSQPDSSDAWELIH